MSLFRSNNHRSRQGGSSNRWWTPGAPEHTPVSFRAGILEMDEAMVKPIESPGVLYVTLNSETNLPVLCWKNRNSGNVDKEIIVIPGQQKVYKCKSASAQSRVFYLKMSDERHFFWMQDSDASKDDEKIERLNKVINDERTMTGNFPETDDNQNDMLQLLQMAGIPSLGDGSRNMANGLLQMLQGHQQDRQRRSRTGPRVGTPPRPHRDQQPEREASQQPQSEPTPAEETASVTRTGETGSTENRESAAVNNSACDQLSDDFAALTSEGLVHGLAAEMQQQGFQDAASLVDILNPENVEILLTDDEVVARLLPFLPNAETATREDIIANIRSPQYMQSLQTFTLALESGELNSVLSQFGVDGHTANERGGGVAGLCHAISSENMTASSSNQGNGASDGTGDEASNNEGNENGDNNDADQGNMDSRPDQE